MFEKESRNIKSRMKSGLTLGLVIIPVLGLDKGKI